MSNTRVNYLRESVSSMIGLSGWTVHSVVR